MYGGCHVVTCAHPHTYNYNGQEWQNSHGDRSHWCAVGLLVCDSATIVVMYNKKKYIFRDVSFILYQFDINVIK